MLTNLTSFYQKLRFSQNMTAMPEQIEILKPISTDLLKISYPSVLSSFKIFPHVLPKIDKKSIFFGNMTLFTLKTGVVS